MLKLWIAFAVMFMPVPAFSQAESELVLAFTGDILLDRGVRRQVEAHGVESLFSEGMDSLLRTADFVVGNLECPATEVKAPVHKKFIFRGEPEWLESLCKHGFTHLNLANNHSMDQGRKGLVSTIKHVKDAGMTPFGAGNDMNEARQPLLLAESPRKVFVVASEQMALENYPFLPSKPSVSAMTVDSLCAKVRLLKRENPGCCVLVCLHWGLEHTRKPLLWQRRDAKMLAEAGADAIIGHHTHTLQSHELIGDVPVFYSIGNFIFDLPAEINRKGAVVLLRIGRNSLKAEAVPYEIRGCTPYLLPPFQSTAENP